MFRLLALLLLLAAPAAAQQANPNPSFNLINKTSQPIRELFASAAGRTNFGQNRLSAGPVTPGGKFAVRLLADGNCIFDIRVVFADGTRQDRRAVNTCTADDVIIDAATPASAAAATSGKKAPDDPSFRLVNRGAQAVAELYTTPAGKTRSGNLLETPLLPKTDRLIAIDRAQGCIFDLRVVLADHSAKERKASDLCKITELPIP